MESTPSFLSLSDYPETGKKLDGCYPGYMSVKDGKLYQIKIFRESPYSIISINDLVKEYLGIQFGELITPGKKCFPKTTVLKDGESWAICSKWIKDTEPLKLNKIKGNEKLQDFFPPSIDEDHSRLIRHGDSLYIVEKGTSLGFPLKHQASNSLFPCVPPSIKITQTPSNQLFYRDLPIENLTQIFTMMKILNMVDIKTDHILVKKKGDHYRATLIDTFSSLENRLARIHLMHPMVDDDDTLLILPYLVESEVWETVDAFLAISKEKVVEVLSAVPNLLTQEEINKFANSIFSTQDILRKLDRSGSPISQNTFLILVNYLWPQGLPKELSDQFEKDLQHQK